MDLYSEEILDHAKNPRNRGVIAEADFTTKKESPLCGEADWVELFIKVKDGRIEEIKFQGEGCAACLASTSMLTEKVKGKAILSVSEISEEEIRKSFGGALSTFRETCAFLPLWTLRTALNLESK